MMENTELITVIIPIYNVISYLDRCIESVLNQTYKELEVIMVDDGSTDGSSELCDQIAQKDTRVRVVHTNNGGAAKARNVGLDLAQGLYIMFVDADDYLAPDICEKMLLVISTYQCNCVVCGLAMVNDNEVVIKKQSVRDLCIVNGLDMLKAQYIGNANSVNIVGPCNKLFNMHMWRNLRFTDGLYYEDLDIMPFLYHDCKKMVLIPDIGYYYYQRTGSASHGTGADDKRFIDSVIIRKKHIQFYQEIGEQELAESVMRMLIELIITADCNGWIPEYAQISSREDFLACWKMLIKSRSVSNKDKLRYLIYRVFGKSIYSQFVQNREN